MANQSDQEISTLLARFDGLAPDQQMAALVAEFVELRRRHAALTARMAAMEAIQAVTDAIAATAVGGEVQAPLPRIVWIGASHALHDAVGFYHLEYDNRGSPFRWSGPDNHFSIPVFVDRAAGAHFRLECGQMYAGNDIEQIQCLVDAELVPLSVTKQAQGFALSGEMPPRPGREGSVITCVLPAVASPQDKGESDSRRLGVKFLSLNIAANAAANAAANNAENAGEGE